MTTMTLADEVLAALAAHARLAAEIEAFGSSERFAFLLGEELYVYTYCAVSRDFEIAHYVETGHEERLPALLERMAQTLIAVASGEAPPPAPKPPEGATLEGATLDLDPAAERHYR